MSIFRWAMSVAGSLLLCSIGFAETARVTGGCTVPPELTRFSVKLTNTARAIRSGKPLIIVAVGSSSTEGIGASDPAHAYPALLGGELRQRWPQVPVTVINKGVRGEIASEMLARFDRDVLSHHPQLVIWQTGSNHALRRESIEGYADTIRLGISRLRAASADVVLMDPQFAPRVLARPKHLMVVDSIGAVGNDMKVAVFRRYAVMRHWVSSGQFKLEDIVTSDGLHLNDVSYSCIARLLAGSVVAATEPAIEILQPYQGAKNTSR